MSAVEERALARKAGVVRGLVGGRPKADGVEQVAAWLVELDEARKLLARVRRGIDRTPTQLHVTSGGPGRPGAIVLLADLREFLGVESPGEESGEDDGEAMRPGDAWDAAVEYLQDRLAGDLGRFPAEALELAPFLRGESDRLPDGWDEDRVVDLAAGLAGV